MLFADEINRVRLSQFGEGMPSHSEEKNRRTGC